MADILQTTFSNVFSVIKNYCILMTRDAVESCYKVGGFLVNNHKAPYNLP